MTNSEDIRDRVIRHILAASDEELKAEDVRPETSLRDELDLSSMQALTLVMDVEDEFGITVEDDELESLRTVGDILTLLDAKRSDG
ncbi:MAG: acyl carrier protein [Acidobacteriota bacterium]